MADQTGRVAVVTGGGRGLGRQIAVALAGAGAAVAAVARNTDQLAETVALAIDEGSITAIPADVSDPEAVRSLGDAVRARLGDPSILVNAAGVFGPISLIKDSDPADWVRTVMVDAIAPYLTVREFLPAMLASRWGRIVNITSAASLHPPGPLNSAYGTAKVALNQFTRHLAAEIAGSGVTANVIHPGDVKTDMWADIREKVATMGPVADAYRQWVTWVEETGGDPPGKAVDLVMRLTSDAGASTNGQFCWVESPLQAPIPSWEGAQEARPWLTESEA